MEDACIHHDPVHIADTGAAEEIVVVIARVIVPHRVIDLEDPAAVYGIQDVLIREYQLFCVISDISEHFFGMNFVSSAL